MNAAQDESRAVGRWVVGVAVSGTIAIAAGAFWLSYTALADLAVRSGVRRDQAWVWPLIVDGVIVVATVAVVALHGEAGRLSRYPWLLLIAGAAVSVAANVIHAAITVPADAAPTMVAALVAAIPPVVLLAITHLTVELTRKHRHDPAPELPREPDERDRDTDAKSPQRRAAPRPRTGPAKAAAAELRRQGMNDSQIAKRLGVHRTTIARWLSDMPPAANSRPHLPEEVAQLADHREGES